MANCMGEDNALTFNDLVEFRVGSGDKEQVFTVHKGKPKTAFACDASPVFMAAFNSRFREGKTQTYILEDVDAKTFDRLLLWIYTKTIEPERMKGLEMESPSKETQEKFDEEVMKFMKLWVLADKLLMPELQNEVVAWLTEMWKLGKCHLKSTSWIPYIWNHTNAGSLIRRFVRAHAMCWVEKDHCLQHSENFPQELLMNVLTSAHEIYKISDKRQLWDEIREESNWFVPESY